MKLQDDKENALDCTFTPDESYYVQTFVMAKQPVLLTGDPAMFRLTIENTAVDTPDTKDGMMYQVTGDYGTDITVAVPNGGAKTITGLIYGNYTVKELDNWSWRYSSFSAQPVLLNSDKTVTFDYDTVTCETRWLDGNSYWSSRTSNRTFRLN